MLFVELAIIAALIAINGFLAMTEIALVSSRPARLSALAEQGVAGARQAALLAADPARFLSTVQIGITLVGILSGAFSGATLGSRLALSLAEAGLSPSLANTLGIGTVVVLITYVALVVGELVPKQLALQNPEAIASRVASTMHILSRAALPAVWVLSGSGRALLRLAGRKQTGQARVTDEELEALVAEAESVGLIEADERQLIAGVLRLGDKAVGQIMTRRDQVNWIDLSADAAETKRALIATEHSHLPVCRGASTRMLGVIRNRELLSALLRDEPLEPSKLVRPAPVVTEHASAFAVLATLRKASVPLALVEDEAGDFQGVVSPVDILDAIAGVVRHDLDDEPAAVRRADGSWLIAGSMPAAEMMERLELALTAELKNKTVGVLMQDLFGRLPETGEATTWRGYRLEVVDLDGRRVDKVLATRLAPPRGDAR
jgi:putative hemolysin